MAKKQANNIYGKGDQTAHPPSGEQCLIRKNFRYMPYRGSSWGMKCIHYPFLLIIIVSQIKNAPRIFRLFTTRDTSIISFRRHCLYMLPLPIPPLTSPGVTKHYIKHLCPLGEKPSTSPPNKKRLCNILLSPYRVSGISTSASTTPSSHAPPK